MSTCTINNYYYSLSLFLSFPPFPSLLSPSFLPPSSLLPPFLPPSLFPLLPSSVPPSFLTLPPSFPFSSLSSLSSLFLLPSVPPPPSFLSLLLSLSLPPSLSLSLPPSFPPLRRLYQLVSYILFFFNVIFGIVMCCLRVFGVVIFTCVMLFRIDWDVYMRGLEGWDIGRRTSVLS